MGARWGALQRTKEQLMAETENTGNKRQSLVRRKIGAERARRAPVYCPVPVDESS